MKNNMLSYEQELYNKGIRYIAGVDEVGRGPLVGPVVTAAVILPVGYFNGLINDSKKLSEKRRNELYEIIMRDALSVSIGMMDNKVIDDVNIYEATKLAMYQAINNLEIKPEYVLIDAMKLSDLEMPSESIIKGDSKSETIAAASIIAKVTRDRLMLQYDEQYPEYGFAQHKGYGTAEHIAALRKYGPCSIHRKSFEPVTSMIKGEII